MNIKYKKMFTLLIMAWNRIDDFIYLTFINQSKWLYQIASAQLVISNVKIICLHSINFGGMLDERKSFLGSIPNLIQKRNVTRKGPNVQNKKKKKNVISREKEHPNIWVQN